MADSPPESQDMVQVVLRLLASDTQFKLRLDGPYALGESRRTYRVVDQHGQRFALKLARRDRIRRAVATTQRLRETGYPAPTYVKTGELAGNSSFALIEELQGQPVERLSVGLTEQLLALIGSHADKAFLPVEEPRIIDTLLFGAKGYALHETMRTYSSSTSSLLDEVIGIGTRYSGLDFRTADIVHYDFNPANMLVVDGQISGVVDWEGTRSGDRAFDIATLLFYAEDAPDAEAMLWRALLDRTGPERASVYLAHMMLRQVEWSARHHEASRVQRYLDRSSHLLRDLRRLS